MNEGVIWVLVFSILVSASLGIAFGKFAHDHFRDKRLAKKFEESRQKWLTVPMPVQVLETPKEAVVLLPKDLLSDLESTNRTDENMKEAVSPRGGTRLIGTLDPAVLLQRQSLLQGVGNAVVGMTQQFQNQQATTQGQQAQAFVSGFIRTL